MPHYHLGLHCLPKYLFRGRLVIYSYISNAPLPKKFRIVSKVRFKPFALLHRLARILKLCMKQAKLSYFLESKIGKALISA